VWQALFCSREIRDWDEIREVRLNPDNGKNKKERKEAA